MAAAALQELEERVLPTYGGRKWTCIVTVKEEPNTVSPYFSWHQKRGRLELAAWPHIVEKMPDPPRFPGYYVGGRGGKRKERNTSTTAAPCAITNLSGENESAFNSEAIDVDEGDEEVLSDELSDLRDLQERNASGRSELAWSERWRVPLPTIQYKWISPLRQSFSSRKLAWEHAVQLCKQEVLLDKVLMGYGANGKPLKLAPLTRKTVMLAGKMRFERDGLWVVGQEESWGLDRLVAEREICRAASPAAIESKAARVAGNVEIDGGSAVPEAITAIVDTGSGHASSATSAASLLEITARGNETKNARRLTGLTYFVQYNRRGHYQKRLTEFRERRSVVSSAVVTPFEKAPATSTPSVALMVSGAKPEFKTPSGKPMAISFRLRDADNELRNIWKSLPEDEKLQWTNSAKKQQDEIDERDLQMKQTVDYVNSIDVETSVNAVLSSNDPPSGSLAVPSDAASAGRSHVISNICAMADLESLNRHLDDNNNRQNGGSLVSDSPSPQESARDAIALSFVTTEIEMAESKSQSLAQNVGSSAVKQTPFDAAFAKMQSEFQRSKKWCLNDEQIKMCYDSGLEHYDQIMRTVTARDLTRELQDGFDLLRERGKGRWDMNLPEWDSPLYSFLNDTHKSPWMPIIKDILGKDVVLIHKGMFLSMPGSDKQVYHQDGPHLSTHYQKPCHAINVFIPLVDLTLENGPTEFCLGSQILGHEEFNENFIETATVKAGTPIIFDYRLGHRGLANTSNSCRPIVYCTYAADANGKEFRDSVNFSRKRYHRIGDLVEKGLTREERAQKRKLAIEEHQIEEAIIASTSEIIKRPRNVRNQNAKSSPTFKSAESDASQPDVAAKVNETSAGLLPIRPSLRHARISIHPLSLPSQQKKCPGTIITRYIDGKTG